MEISFDTIFDYTVMCGYNSKKVFERFERFFYFEYNHIYYKFRLQQLHIKS